MAFVRETLEMHETRFVGFRYALPNLQTLWIATRLQQTNNRLQFGCMVKKLIIHEVSILFLDLVISIVCFVLIHGCNSALLDLETSGHHG